MKLSRLVQPRNPLFWLLILLNALSSAISFVLRGNDLPVAVTLMLAAFAVGNVLIGIYIALRLMADAPAASRAPPPVDRRA